MLIGYKILYKLLFVSTPYLGFNEFYTMRVLEKLNVVPVVRKCTKNAYSIWRFRMEAYPGGRMLLSCGQWLSKEKICFSPLIIFSALPFILIWGMSAIAILFVIIPFVGDGAASAHLGTWVVAAEYCVPLSNRDARSSTHGNKPEKPEDSSLVINVTPCLFLWKNDAVVAKGRHIVSTNSHIVLFDPSSGEVRLEPIDGVSVRMDDIQAVK
ncbi:hypothetical protein ACVFVO_17735 [Advenella kashmirensis]